MNILSRIRKLKMLITNLELDKIVPKKLIKYNLKNKILGFKMQPYCYIYRNNAEHTF